MSASMKAQRLKESIAHATRINYAARRDICPVCGLRAPTTYFDEKRKVRVWKHIRLHQSSIYHEEREG